MIQGAIFDMDGVLVNNTPVHIRAFEIFCDRYGVRDWQSKLGNAYGMGNDDIMRLILPEELIRTRGLAALADEKEAIYREIYAPEIQPTPGLVETLGQLRAAGAPRRKRIDEILLADASILAQHRGQMVKDVDGIAVLLLPTASFQRTLAADLIHCAVVHLLQTSGLCLVQLLRNRLGGVGNLPQSPRGFLQTLQKQLSDALVCPGRWAAHRLLAQKGNG